MEELLFPDPDGIDILFFWMECNRCGERWLHICCQCPHCGKVDFRVMDAKEIKHAPLTEIFANNIHYVFLNEDA